jgi:hypothetical protein
MKSTLPCRVLTLVFLTLIVAGCEPERIRLAKDAVRDVLREPDTAQFRNVVDHGHVVCGEVNAKNGFGGFTGFQDFYVIGKPPRRAVLVDERSDFTAEIWADNCI